MAKRDIVGEFKHRRRCIQTFIENNKLSYDELMSLDSEKCVKVSRSYFYFLYAKCGFIKNIDKSVYKIFDEYISYERMHDVISNNGIARYYLMCADDIKQIIISSGENEYYSTAILKTDVDVLDMEEENKRLQELYIERMNQQKVKQYNA